MHECCHIGHKQLARLVVELLNDPGYDRIWYCVENVLEVDANYVEGLTACRSNPERLPLAYGVGPTINNTGETGLQLIYSAKHPT